MMFDVAVIGSGPAGASCAASCARAGLRTLLLEREKFPREKVCGDCLNPACWPVLERLAVADRVHRLPHGKIERVEFIAIGGRAVGVDLPRAAEIAVKRSAFDELLQQRAMACGAEVQHATLEALTPRWTLTTSHGEIAARVVVAADGRNSTVARLLGLLPRFEKERVGLQAHVPLPEGFGRRVVLQLLPDGYSGQAPVGGGELNLCLVGRPAALPRLRAWAEAEFHLPRGQTWRTITPLRRPSLSPAQHDLFLVGDAARVVEPFTGEGIFYALRSGELAAQAVIQQLQHGDTRAADWYRREHQQLYRGRLWVNRLARAAVLSPRFTSALLRSGFVPPALLEALTTKVVR
ncbi:geranylgeranyl reductase family protein [soil metagenome]